MHEQVLKGKDARCCLFVGADHFSRALIFEGKPSLRRRLHEPTSALIDRAVKVETLATKRGRDIRFRVIRPKAHESRTVGWSIGVFRNRLICAASRQPARKREEEDRGDGDGANGATKAHAGLHIEAVIGKTGAFAAEVADMFSRFFKRGGRERVCADRSALRDALHASTSLHAKLQQARS